MRPPIVSILTMLGSAVAYVMLALGDSLWLDIASRVPGGLMAGHSASATGRAIGPMICGPLYSHVGMGAPFLPGAARRMNRLE